MGGLEEIPGDLGPFGDPEIVRHLVDDSTVLFLALDDEVRISWIGQSCLQILGRRAEDLVGRSGLELIHPDDVHVVAATMAETVRNAEERILAVIRVSHVDGTWVRLEFGGIDLRESGGDGTFLVWGRSYESAQQLTDFLGSLLGGTDLELLLGRVVRWCDSLSPYSASLLLLRGPEGLQCSVASNTLPDGLGLGLAQGGDSGFWERQMLAEAPAEFDLSELTELLGARATRAGLFAVWCAPIPGLEAGKADGLVVSWRLRIGLMLATHRRHLQETARLAQLALLWASNHDALLVAATTDSLTGLANRGRFERAVAESRSDGALLFCDLDRFKALNDEYGHGAGDRVLAEVAQRLSVAVRPVNTLARFGGDEFAVWCPAVTDLAEALEIGSRLVIAGRHEISVGGASQSVTCSVGVTLARQREGRIDLVSAMEDADQALYRAKAARRDCAQSVAGNRSK